MSLYSKLQALRMSNLKLPLIITLILTILMLFIGVYFGSGLGFSSLIQIFILILVIGFCELVFALNLSIVNATIQAKSYSRMTNSIKSLGLLSSLAAVRLLFPFFIIAVLEKQNPFLVFKSIFADPVHFAFKFNSHSAEISAFTGIILLLVSLTFIVDRCRETQWFNLIVRVIGYRCVVVIPSVIAFLVINLYMLGVPGFYKFKIIKAILLGFIFYLVAKGAVYIYSSWLKLNGNQTEDNSRKAVNFSVFTLLSMALLNLAFSFNSVLAVFTFKIYFLIPAVILIGGVLLVRFFTRYILNNSILITSKNLITAGYYSMGVLALSLFFNITAVRISVIYPCLVMLVILWWGYRAKVSSKL